MAAVNGVLNCSRCGSRATFSTATAAQASVACSLSPQLGIIRRFHDLQLCVEKCSILLHPRSLRLWPAHALKDGKPLDAGAGEGTTEGELSEFDDFDKVQNEEEAPALEKALGRAFGGPLWFGILLLTLAIFGGGYVYLIVEYADFSTIPILNGPQNS
eukprot:TRINITY_DN16975_c0_g1_i1.p1 TRINITY_DN16975_c0_g1~~TRINITY_DN16975_c0_g1_i1.p1  ORF type:complete len:158 (+),score=5.97 TRINITY_DN16975_c0_g1_i1:49-522(+)